MFTMKLMLALALLSGCDEEPEPVFETSPVAETEPVETAETGETVEAAEDVESETPVPPFKPSPEQLASARTELRRRIRSAADVDSSELWEYVHENGTDNDIARMVGHPLEPIPPPSRSCGSDARRAAERRFASIREEMEDPGLIPRVECSVEAERVVCDYTSNAHNTLRFVARVRTSGELDLWAALRIGSRYTPSPRRGPPSAWIVDEERDIASFIATAEADPCPVGPR